MNIYKKCVHSVSAQLTEGFIKIAYVIHNLATHGAIYIPKGTVITYADDEEPEMDFQDS